MSLYQSPLWRHITKEIYKKPTFEIELLGKRYFGVYKQQRKLGKSFRWYMVHGVTLGDVTYFNKELKQALKKLKRDHYKSFGDLFLQLGCADKLDERPTTQVKQDDVRAEMKQQRDYVRSDLWQRYNLTPSWREHMPNATIHIDLNQSAAELKGELSTSGRRYLNKGKRADLEFVATTKKADRKQFRETWYRTSYDKGFNIVPEKQFLQLMDYLDQENAGQLFLARKGKDIVSGSVCLFLGDQLVYLYGATDRSFGSIGGHYWLTYQIMKWGSEQESLTHLDMLGVATPGYEKGHYLQGVTRFKQSFGGKTISYLGNYDLIFNALGYKGFKLLRG